MRSTYVPKTSINETATKNMETIHVFSKNLYNPPAMDADMDELMDLLAYECPYTGKKRIPGCYESVDQQSSTKCLGSSKIRLGNHVQ